MRFKTNLFLVLFASFLFIGTHGYAQKTGGCNGQKGNGAGLENKIPDLTDKQKEDIEKIRLDQRKKSLPITNELAEKRAHLNTLKTTDPIDQKAIDKEIEDIGRLRTNLNKLQSETHLKIRNVLTDEQKVVFDSHAGQGMHKGKKPGCGSKPGCGHKCGH